MICKSCGTAASDEVRLCPGCGVTFLSDVGTTKSSRDGAKANPGRWMIFFICLLTYAVISFTAFTVVGFMFSV